MLFSFGDDIKWGRVLLNLCLMVISCGECGCGILEGLSVSFKLLGESC